MPYSAATGLSLPATPPSMVMPSGAPATGGGSTASTQHNDLLTAGGAIVAGGIVAAGIAAR